HGLYRKLDINQLLSTSSAITLTNDVTFNNRVTFADSDMAGVATISMYTDKVDVAFQTPFASTPIITYTLTTPTASDSAFLAEGRRVSLTNASSAGFTLQLDSLAPRDYSYYWFAISVPTGGIE
ncbi:MAG: hypothetical protein UX38_C0006G0043, partial [Microgenomates group bacterium GW2011_GWC1_46_16]